MHMDDILKRIIFSSELPDNFYEYKGHPMVVFDNPYNAAGFIDEFLNDEPDDEIQVMIFNKFPLMNVLIDCCWDKDPNLLKITQPINEIPF